MNRVDHWMGLVHDVEQKPRKSRGWTQKEWISWGQYIVSAIEHGWDDDLDLAVKEFVDIYGRRFENEEGNS